MKYPEHKIAALFPLPGEDALKELAESIQRSGQREPIVLFEGEVLDGRSRQRACEIANVEPIYREWGDRPTDGTSPTRFVMDLNFERRHLTPSQRAMIAQSALAMYQDEAKARQDAGLKGEAAKPEEKGSAASHAAKSAGVSTRHVEKAAALATTNPEKAEEVLKGEKTLHQASEEAQDEQEAQDEAAAKADAALQARRKDLAKQWQKAHGKAFAEAVTNGTVLKTESELTAFEKADSEEQTAILELVIQGWSVKKAIKFTSKVLDTKDTIESLIIRATTDPDKKKKEHTYEVAGWSITLKEKR